MYNKKCACVRLMGGLGNQLFQYAFGQRLALSGNQVLYDIENGFRYDKYRRRYMLDAFDFEVPPASTESIPMGISWRPPFHRIPKVFWNICPKASRRVFYERSPFQYDSYALEGNTNYEYFIGYWQNLSYLNPVEKALRQNIRLRTESIEFKKLRLEMINTPSVSVHIRQYNDIDKTGKVITRAKQVHGVCDINYYNKSIKHIPREKNLTAYVFTDDIEWSKKHIRLNMPCLFVSDIGLFSDAEEMMLMASCKHHVISNSTFSWWAAWMDKTKSKVVIAPKSWHKNHLIVQSGIFPENWIII
jgi:hypothetical protein